MSAFDQSSTDSTPCDEIECYTRWQALNANRDGYLDRALTAEIKLERLYAKGLRAWLARWLIR